MVRDDLKLPDDSGEVPKPNGVVGSPIPGCEIISLLDGNQLGGQKNTSCVPKKGKIHKMIFHLNLLVTVL